MLANQWAALTARCAEDVAAMRDPQEVRERLQIEFAAMGDRLSETVGAMAETLESASDA